MEQSALELYVRAVESGKQGEGGFKPEVHPWVASELLKDFPGNPFTSAKVKSKYTQGFKKIYNAFVACKGASGFGWNEAKSMVTASEDVWNSFLVLHPSAKRFKNTPFPEYSDFQTIFEGHTARGDMHQSPGTETNKESAALETADSGNLPETLEATRAPTQRPGVQPPRRHRITSGDRFENSIDQLVDAFISSNTKTESPASSPIHLALEKFQEKFADDLGLDELVAGFSVLESDSKAQCFLAIKNDDHARAWINRQIASKMVPDS
ncbi:uncharacterized protein PGTG_06949 [Puccinia graminis f. sp. tritici CRL 75-36-700-3]|uniref:Myb/SANT-like domain-containing protein n=1 Tax=Puccinia graminis f. sp. tritici (strain CRL 75-36-700-3 / race SCCL) TaxID=418459 RepID=E3KAK4_PUCGT|nr:uncharacterized protein PGTG_06949 [Puccinia graminis f. sp. tritici CRL 75-36-700-3]EFP81328.2 hypothetical protein PGTG_06949 [Puccinia graminis f. sp. tritici CRL 75-36-700-3]